MAKNQMYKWIEKCVNPLAGECPHHCTYCYVKSLKKRFDHENAKAPNPKFPDLMGKYSGEPRIDEKGLAEIRGKGKTIFVCSATDMFAENVSGKLIQQIMTHCWGFRENTYLWQSKNPGRFLEFRWLFPPKSILAVTVEHSGLYNEFSRAPSIHRRLTAMTDFTTITRRQSSPRQLRFMISIEPVMGLREVEIEWIEVIAPDIISIGANTSNVKLPEPTADELLELIKRMRQITPDVRLKDNLARIIGADKLAELQAEVNDG